MTYNKRIKTSFNNAQISPLTKAFAHYKDRVNHFFETAELSDNKAQLAAQLKELDILWRNVVGIRGSDGPKGDGLYKAKRCIDVQIDAVMKDKGITAVDVTKAKLFRTSTGRKTAVPQFKRRFD